MRELEALPEAGAGFLAAPEGEVKTVVGPGQRLTVPVGTPHTFWNAGDEVAHFVCEVRPALQFESLLETMFALVADGKTNRKEYRTPCGSR